MQLNSSQPGELTIERSVLHCAQSHLSGTGALSYDLVGVSGILGKCTRIEMCVHGVIFFFQLKNNMYLLFFVVRSIDLPVSFSDCKPCLIDCVISPIYFQNENLVKVLKIIIYVPSPFFRIQF